MLKFGPYLRRHREALRKQDPRFSVRQLAARIGVEPSYLSKVERALEPPPSEHKIRALARELGQDPDALLALAGKVAGDLQATIRRRPILFSTLIRELRHQSDTTVQSLIRTAQSSQKRKEKR